MESIQILFYFIYVYLLLINKFKIFIYNFISHCNFQIKNIQIINKAK